MKLLLNEHWDQMLRNGTLNAMPRTQGLKEHD